MISKKKPKFISSNKSGPHHPSFTEPKLGDLFKNLQHNTPHHNPNNNNLSNHTCAPNNNNNNNSHHYLKESLTQRSNGKAINNSILSKAQALLNENNTLKAAKLLVKYYMDSRDSKLFIFELERLKYTFPQQYPLLCSHLLAQIIPNAQDEDTQLLLKLFEANMR